MYREKTVIIYQYNLWINICCCNCALAVLWLTMLSFFMVCDRDISWSGHTHLVLAFNYVIIYGGLKQRDLKGS